MFFAFLGSSLANFFFLSMFLYGGSDGTRFFRPFLRSDRTDKAIKKHSICFHFAVIDFRRSRKKKPKWSFTSKKPIKQKGVLSRKIFHRYVFLLFEQKCLLPSSGTRKSRLGKNFYTKASRISYVSTVWYGCKKIFLLYSRLIFFSLIKMWHKFGLLCLNYIFESY